MKMGIVFPLCDVEIPDAGMDGNEDVATIDFPHVIHCAPNVSKDRDGGANLKPEDLGYLLEHGHWQSVPYP